MKALMAVAALALASAAVAGNVCEWTGLGDGVSWNDAQNWKDCTKPVSGNGDTVRIGNFAGPINNNIGRMELQQLWFEGSTAVTLTGEAIALGKDDEAFKNSCKVVLDVPLELSGAWVRFVPGHSIDFMRDVTLAASCRFSLIAASQLSSKAIHFYGELNGGRSNGVWLNIAIGDTDCHVYFHKKASFYCYQSPGKYWRSPIHFCAPGNEYDSIYVCYQHVYFDCANATDPGARLYFGEYYTAANHSRYVFGNFGQVVNRVVCASNPGLHATVGDGSDMVLTMCAKNSETTTVQVRGKCSVDWAPTSNLYVGTFKDTAHTTEGDLIVSAGEFKVSGSGSFASVPKVWVKANAKFTVDSTSSSAALAGVRTLLVENGGVFAVGSNCAMSPLSGELAVCDLRSSGKFSVPGGKSISCAAVRRGGLFVEQGVYTGEGGPVGRVVGWIEGTGTVNVAGKPSNLVEWAAAVDGAWGDSGKWLPQAVPTSAQDVSISVCGADYEVGVTGDVALGGGLTLDNDGAHETTLSVEAGASLTYDPSSSGVEAGEEVARMSRSARLVSAGNLSITNLVGDFVIDGKIVATGGTVGLDSEFAGNAKQGRIVLRPGAEMLITNTVVNIGYNQSTACYPIEQVGGDEYFCGSTVLNLGPVWDSPFGGGLTRFSGSAQCVLNGSRDSSKPTRVMMTHGAENVATARVEFVDHAKFVASVYDYSRFGAEAWHVTVVRYASDATSDFGNLYVNPNTDGDVCMSIESGTVKASNANTGVFIGGRGVEYSDSRGSCKGRGELHITGGKLEVASKKSAFRGIFIGDGQVKAGSGREGSGLLHVAGGEVEMSGSGAIVVGAGANSGELVMTGGSISALGTEAVTNHPMVVGFADGIGSVVISNGEFVTRQDVYVGGVTTNVLAWAGNTTGVDSYGLRHSSVGSFEMAAADTSEPCSFETTGRMAVGFDGVGSVRMGPGAAMSVGGMRLCGASSSLAFDVGAAGDAGTICVDGTLAVEPGAKLEVDLSSCPSIDGMVWLVRCLGMEGAFSSEDIEIKGASHGIVLRQNRQGVSVGVPRGAALVIR